MKHCAIAVAATLAPLIAWAQAPPPVAAPAEMDAAAYAWLAEWPGELPPAAPLLTVFPTPAGFARGPAAEGSFAGWLRRLPLRLDRTTVLLHNGAPIAAPAAAVVLLDLGQGDLQQCADSILRLHAEYLWSGGRTAGLRYHFTSGDPSGWREWVDGEAFRVRGSRVERLEGQLRPANHASFRAWLHNLFLYAGTLSLARDSRAVPASVAIEAGDFFLEPGSPGHAVLVLDVATAGDGRRVGLVGQGYTPAQEMHVLRGGDATVLDGAWFPLPTAPGETLSVPSWRPFPRASARRFPSLGE